MRDNLLYGVNREVSQKELEAVCRDANCLDFIESWPERFETMVGEKGVKLSGGQKQVREDVMSPFKAGLPVD